MKTFVKNYLKNKFPEFSLHFRVQKILNEKMDPDLYFLANFKTYLLQSPNTKIFLDYLSKGNTAVDVGACLGEYSYVLANNFKHVLSCDPIPENIVILRRALPKNCETIECVLGEEIGEVHLRIPKIGD